MKMKQVMSDNEHNNNDINSEYYSRASTFLLNIGNSNAESRSILVGCPVCRATVQCLPESSIKNENESNNRDINIADIDTSDFLFTR